MPTNGSRVGKIVVNCAQVKCQYSRLKVKCDGTHKVRQKATCALWKECHQKCANLVAAKPTIDNLKLCWQRICARYVTPQTRKYAKCAQKECFRDVHSFKTLWKKKHCMWRPTNKVIKRIN